MSNVDLLEEEHLGKAYDHRLMKRLLGYLRPSTKLIVLAILLLVLQSLAELGGPMLTRIAIDEHIAKGDAQGLLRVSLLWLALIVIGAILTYVQAVVMSLIGQRAMLRLRDQIYSHLHRLPVSFFDHNPVGRLMTRLTNDVEVLNQMFTQGVVAIFGDIVTLIGIMIVLFVMDVRLALVTLASVPLLVVATLQFRLQIRGAYRDIRVALAKINSYLQESLSGIAVIKALRRERRNESEFGKLATDHREAFLRSVKAFSVYYPMVEIIEALAIALVLWYGGGKILQNELTFGALVAFIQYAGRFFRPIRDLSEKYNILQDAMASSERIFKLLDEPAESVTAVTTAKLDPRGTIRFEDVHFSYDGKTPVLQGVTFEVPAGRTTAIVGSTGAGKTTLVGLLARFYDPERGRITIGGTDLAAISRAELRRALAIVQQDVYLFSGSIDENVRLGETIPDARMREALRMSHTDSLLARLPGGLSTPVGERGGSLSTGERQLIAFARALAFDPQILILDEATASIDSETEALIQDALAKLVKDRTAIVIAHRLSTIRSADQILVLHHGRVAERGTHEELLERGGIYARLYRLQFQLPDLDDARAEALPQGDAESARASST